MHGNICGHPALFMRRCKGNVTGLAMGQGFSDTERLGRAFVRQSVFMP